MENPTSKYIVDNATFSEMFSLFVWTIFAPRKIRALNKHLESGRNWKSSYALSKKA